MKKDSKTPLFENDEELLNKILRNIDKYIRRTGKGEDNTNAFRAEIEKKLQDINPNVTDSSVKRTYKNVLDKQDESKNLQLSDIKKVLEYKVRSKSKQLSEVEKKKLGQKIARGFDYLTTGLVDKKLTREKALGLFKELLDSIYNTGVVNKQVLVKTVQDLPHKKPNPNQQDESKTLELSDIERLLEYIQEAEKQEPKSKKEKETPKPKEEEPVSPSKAIEKFQNSTAASNLKADLKRMSSRGDKIQAILQLLRSLPGISDTAIRRAIVNAFKTKN